MSYQTEIEVLNMEVCQEESGVEFCNGYEKALQDVLPVIERAVAAERKAFGGCLKCYGKGYGTQTIRLVSRRHNEPAPTMVFCSCDRGSQLAALTTYQIKNSV